MTVSFEMKKKGSRRNKKQRRRKKDKKRRKKKDEKKSPKSPPKTLETTQHPPSPQKKNTRNQDKSESRRRRNQQKKSSPCPVLGKDMGIQRAFKSLKTHSPKMRIVSDFRNWDGGGGQNVLNARGNPESCPSKPWPFDPQIDVFL